MKRTAIMLFLAIACCAYAQDKNSPQTLKGILLEQLKTTHNVKDWFVPADIAVEGLTAEQANWTDGKGNHSVGQEVNHLVYWDNYELMKFKGETPPKFNGNNDETFNKFDAKQWTSLVKQMDDVMTAWEQAVKQPTTKRLRNGVRLSPTSAPTTRITSARLSTSASCRDRGMRIRASSDAQPDLHFLATAVVRCCDSPPRRARQSPSCSDRRDCGDAASCWV